VLRQNLCELAQPFCPRLISLPFRITAIQVMGTMPPITIRLIAISGQEHPHRDLQRLAMAQLDERVAHLIPKSRV
jgi:hypothetical protein